MNAHIAPEDLSKFVLLTPETGALTWKARPEIFFASGRYTPHRAAAAWNSRWAGKAAFTSLNSEGYLCGRLERVSYRAHRVVWALVYGEWPNGFIDHINHVRTDNRIGNLRVVNSTENQRNVTLKKANVSGVTGVFWHKASKKWSAFIGDEGKVISLGYHQNFDDAVAARKAAEIRLGYHPNHGLGDLLLGGGKPRDLGLADFIVDRAREDRSAA